MSFFHKKNMSQNVWATIMPFAPVTLIFHCTSYAYCIGTTVCITSSQLCNLHVNYWMHQVVMQST